MEYNIGFANADSVNFSWYGTYSAARNNGIITRLFGLNWNIYGMWGIVIGSVMYAFPVAFLMIRDILKYEDRSPYEAAEILGIPKWRQFTAITVPYLRKPLISVIFAVFTMIVTDYGVPLIVGGKFSTIPVVMYQEVIGQLDFGKGAVYGVILLIPAVVAFVFDLLNKDRGNSSFVTKKFEGTGSKLKKIFAYLFCRRCFGMRSASHCGFCYTWLCRKLSGKFDVYI